MPYNNSDSFYKSDSFYNCDVIMTTLTKSFMHDAGIVVLNNVPYVDDNELDKEHYINYAIISAKSAEPVAIAILVKFADSVVPEEEEKRLEKAVEVLIRLKWIPLVFSEKDLWFSFSEVKNRLDSLLSAEHEHNKDKQVKKISSACIKKDLKISRQTGSNIKKSL